MSEKVDVKRVQNRLLEMAKEIARVLEKHDIPHMIAYGTLLGAVRHGGFIPWDDDFDFLLFEDTFALAMETLEKELPSDLFLEYAKTEPLYFHAWSHVKDLNTIAHSSAFPQDSLYAHKGLSIDLYRAPRILLSKIPEWINTENEKYLERRHNNGLISEKEYELRMRQLEEKKKTARETPFEGEDRYVYGRRSGAAKPYMEETDLFPLKRIRFADYNFWGPNNPDAVLTRWYGDYLQLPSEEKRLGHYDKIEYLKH